MTARKFVESLGGIEQFDKDYKIPLKEINHQKLEELKIIGFKLYFWDKCVHIHPPFRNWNNFYDRGWDEEILNFDIII